MKFFRESFPYLNQEGDFVDFNKKRLEFWLETVPSDLRRLEYELYKRNRRIINAGLYRFEHKQKHGRFTILPSFTEELDYDSWRSFQESFLGGNERKERFTEILESVKRDIPTLIKENQVIIPNQIRLVAIAGSSFVGPRRPGEPLSDIDINFILDQEDNKLNFNILPNANSGNKNPYHLFGTGYGDEGRGEGRDIHWLLYPHYPVENHIPDDELRSIIEKLVESTEKRKDEIISSIESKGKIITEMKNSKIME